MLEAIQSLSADSAARLMPTLLIHIPPAIATERSSYMSRVCEELISEVARRNLATAVDIFVEKEAWQVAEAEELFRRAKHYGLAIKLHSDPLALSVRLNGLTVEEALVAGTVNAACALGINDTGRLEAGCAADFLVLQSSDWRDLVYTLGANPVRDVWIGGKKVR